MAMQEHALERLLLPLSGLTSWLIVLAGGLSVLHVLGINVAPLLTVGGVSGILVGLSAQSVMANMIAGINLVTLALRRYCSLIHAVWVSLYEDQLKGLVSQPTCTAALCAAALVQPPRVRSYMMHGFNMVGGRALLTYEHICKSLTGGAVWLQFLSRPFVVGDRIDILTSGGTKFATGFVERVDPIYTVLRTDTGTPVTINNKAWLPALSMSSEMPR